MSSTMALLSPTMALLSPIMLSSTLLTLSTLTLVLGQGCFDYDTDYYGHDVEDGHYNSVDSAEACQHDCQASAACQFWTWDKSYNGACWHKTAKGQVQSSPGLVSGPKYCGEQTTQGPGGDQTHLRVLSYNMYGWNALEQNPWKAENMYKAIRANNPDLLGAQEVVDYMVEEIAGHIGGDYQVAGPTSAGHTIFYRDSVLEFQDWGFEELHEQDQWGLRTLEWAQFSHLLSGRQVDHFNVHLCVCSDDQLLGSARTMAQKIAALRRPGSILFLTGDFNVIGKYENSKAIQYLTGKLEDSPVVFVDTFRKANGDSVDGTTFPGLGKIDYILTEPQTGVWSSAIDRNNYGDASDHLPINSVLQL